MVYFNTTNETGQQLKQYKARASSQAGTVLLYFRDNSEYVYTPDEIQTTLFPDTPITSIRRAITVLTSNGYLIKHDEMFPGKYGRLTHCWGYNNEM